MTLMQNIKIVNIGASSKDQDHDLIDWPAVSDQKLLDFILTHPASSTRGGRAWIEFLERFDDTINKRVRFMVGRCARMYRGSDTFHDAKAEVFVAMLANDKGRLRAFDASLGSLKNWIAMISKQAALAYLMRLSRHEVPDPLEAVEEADDREDSDESTGHIKAGGQRGAYWVANGL